MRRIDTENKRYTPGIVAKERKEKAAQLWGKRVLLYSDTSSLERR